jgi:hypothetical protein
MNGSQEKFERASGQFGEKLGGCPNVSEMCVREVGGCPTCVSNVRFIGVSMKHFVLLAMLVFLSLSADAATFYATGYVRDVSSNDRTTYGADSNGFSIVGFSSAGACAMNDGLVWMVLRDNIGGSQQLAILLAAKLSGMPVSIRVNDAIRASSGACYLQVLNMDLNS